MEREIKDAMSRFLRLAHYSILAVEELRDISYYADIDNKAGVSKSLEGFERQLRGIVWSSENAWKYADKVREKVREYLRKAGWEVM